MKTKRILVVDDEAGFTRMLKMTLESTGRYEVGVVNWPEDALAAAKAFQPDLVLLDVFMPRMCGGDVAVQLKSRPEFRDLPIVFLTAAIRSSVVLVQDHAGVVGDVPFIAKPASIEEVMACIDRALEPGTDAEGGGSSRDPPEPLASLLDPRITMNLAVQRPAAQHFHAP